MKLKREICELKELIAKKDENISKAHGIIEELEFELDEIDYLESENEELRRQIKFMTCDTGSDT